MLTGSAAAASLALAAGLLGASPAPVHHGLGQALALSAIRATFPAQVKAASGPRRGSDGRYIYDRPSLTGRAAGQQPATFRRPGALLRPNAAAGTPLVNEAVQTFDVFNPAPAFAPPTGQNALLAATNLNPVWTADETMIIFSSNRTLTGGVQTDGRFHIWAIPVNGGAPAQLTSSTGPTAGGTAPGTMKGEFFPALSSGNNQYLAFTSDAQTPGTQNLYRIQFSPTTVNVSDTSANGPSSLTVRNDAFAVGAGGTGFTQVGRPTFAGRPDEIVFAALAVGGSNASYRNHFHLYYMFTGTGGSDPSNPSLPAKVTDGPTDETDPAYSADAQFIAFASTATAITQANQQPGGRLDQTLSLTSAPGTNRNLFLLGGGGRSSAFGSVTLAGKPLNTTGTDNYGPAWSSLNRNAYLNPAPGAEYLAFSRGNSPAATHDIYYLQVLRNVDSSGESGRSNEAATTPLPALTPVYSLNGGGPAVGNFTPDAATPGVITTGGTAETITPPVVTNTVNDPTAPSDIYKTDRNGTFDYLFSNLTPGTNYVVRVHLSDFKNATTGKRLFNIFVNGQLQTVTVPGAGNTSTIDIVQLAQSSPGRVDGLVTDSVTGNPIPGATITVTNAAGQPVATTPSPLTTSATPTPDPAGGANVNYNTPLPQAQYTVTVTAPNYPAQSQTLNVSSGAVVRADFSLTQAATGTVTGTVKSAAGTPLSGVPLTVITVGPNNTPGANIAGPFATTAGGNYSLTLPAGSYFITAEPANSYQVLTKTVAVTAGANTPTDFSLQTGSAIGTVGGLVTNSVSNQLLGGVLVEVLQGQNVFSLTRTSTAPTTPAAPNGDGKAINYQLRVPTGDYTVQFLTPGYTSQPAAVTVVNTTGPPANAFVRLDAPQVSQAAVVGQNTAVVQDFVTTPTDFATTNQAGLITPSATIRVAFAPVANGGDPPIVQGIELLSSRNPGNSSGLGSNPNRFNRNTSGGVSPILDSAIGGDGIVNLSYRPSNGTPSYFNIYRTTQGSGQEGSLPYRTNITTTTFLDTPVQNGVEYYYQVSAVYLQSLTPEGAAVGTSTPNAAVKLNTDDNAVSALGGQYEDAYPTWAPGVSLFSIAYSSNRSVTYNSPVTNRPSETAISVPQGGALGGGGTVGAAYTGIFESQVINLDPPTLIPYSGSEVVHIADQNGVQARANLTGGRPMTVTVRLSSREAGVDDSNVYVQIKDPDSKYQDSQRQEHKVFTRDSLFRSQANNPYLNSPDSGSSSLLFNGGGFPGANFFNIDGPFFTPQRGAVGGTDTFNNGGESISVGVVPTANQNSTNPVTTGDDGKPLLDAKGNPNIPPGFDPQFFVPAGQEYEAQAVNPVYATTPNGPGNDTVPSDYSNPYYLAGVDDQRAFSGFAAPGTVEGTVNTYDFTTGNSTPVGGATLTIADALTGAPVATTPSSLISSSTTTTFPDGNTGNIIATLAPGQYRVTTTLAGYGTNIQTIFVTERGTSKINVYLFPGTQTNDYSFVDSQAQSGNGHSPRPTASYTVNATNITPAGIPVTTPVFHPAEWLQLTRLPDAQQDGGGGVLYSVSWTPPVSGSDYYLDVIAYDKAVFPNFAGGTSPFSGERSNWRIYDNVWGFSTLRDIGANDILFVSDYALGQKFAGTTFGGQSSLTNLVPKFYGAESYLTDIDVSLLPNSTDTYRVIGGRKFPIEEVLPLAAIQGYGNSANIYGNTHTLNGLGVGSYADPNIDDGQPIDGVPAVVSQRYSIWRTLSRGPVPDSVFQSYQPKTATQPAVSDNTVTPAVTYPAGQVTVAPRCIVWSAPFAGDLLVGPGTITDPATQTSLRAFVKAGGRLFMTGQDIGSSITQNGTTGNAAGGFLSDVLGATLVTGNKGTFTAAGGTNVADNRISNVAFFDGENRMNFYQLEASNSFLFHSPSEFPIIISNNIGGNTFTGNVAYKELIKTWRTDGSLDQLGPYATPFNAADVNLFRRFNFASVNSLGIGNSVVGQIDTIAPANPAAHIDFKLTPFTNTLLAQSGIGNPGAATSPGGNGLLYYSDTATGGTGAKVVYASFGFEGLSTEYYAQQLPTNPPTRIFLPHNQRQNMLHNIVCYLRTGTVSGTIRATSGNGSPGAGISGATVYLVSSNGTTIPGRGTFSATSDTTGNYRIDGVEPGTYTVAAYKNGFTRTTSNTTTTFTVEGDATQNASLTLLPAAPGTLSGTVKDAAGNLIAGATVTFNPAGGGTAQIATTNANGIYSLPTIPAGTYTGTASLLPAYGASPAQTVTIVASAASTANFVLSAATGTVTGRVINTAGAGIVNASVIFTTGSPATVVTTATTTTNGTYTATVPAGSYTLTATATTYGSASVTVQAAGGASVAAPDLILGAPANGTLGGLVLSTTGAAPLAGATITVASTGTGTIQTATSTATTVAASDGGTINYGPLTLAQGTYTITASRGGVTTTPQTVTITAGTFTRQDFSGLTGLPAIYTFPAGLQFVSLPYNYASLGFDGVFGPLNTATTAGNRSHVALWDPVASSYVLDPTAPADAPRLGVGYWVFLKNATPVTQAGTTPTGTVSVALHPAWNQIGVPSIAGVKVANLRFMGSDGVSRTFADAAGAQFHLISPTLYRYDGTAYQPISPSDTLQPWTAYWIRVYADVTLQIPTGK